MMVKNVIFFLFAALIVSCNSLDKRPLVGETDYQRQQNAQFKDASKSPLKKKDLKSFKGLDFFPVDSSFIVTAKLTRTPDSPFFKLPRTGGDKVDYRQYGLLTFTLKGKEFLLSLYQNLEEMNDPKFEDYLFLPFTDHTCGETSYGGGRYMNLFESRIQEDETIVLNFNNTYNPYCAYNDRYNCPIVPRKNHMDIAITAGIKNFKK